MGPGVYGPWPNSTSDNKTGRAPQDAPAHRGPAGGLPVSGETVAALPAGPADVLSEKDRALIERVERRIDAAIRFERDFTSLELPEAYGLLELIRRQDDVIRKQRAAISEALEECR